MPTSPLLIAGEHPYPRAAASLCHLPRRGPLYFCSSRSTKGPSLRSDTEPPSKSAGPAFTADHPAASGSPDAGAALPKGPGVSFPGDTTPAVPAPRPCSLIAAGFLRGGKVLFTTCHLVFQWVHVYIHQRIGFGGAYRPGCKCQVSGPCVGLPCSPGSGPCPPSLFLDLLPVIVLSGWPWLPDLLLFFPSGPLAPLRVPFSPYVYSDPRAPTPPPAHGLRERGGEAGATSPV